MMTREQGFSKNNHCKIKTFSTMIAEAPLFQPGVSSLNTRRMLNFQPTPISRRRISSDSLNETISIPTVVNIAKHVNKFSNDDAELFMASLTDETQGTLLKIARRILGEDR